MAAVTENVDPNLSIASGGSTMVSPVKGARRPPRSNKRISFSPKRPTVMGGGRRRRSSSHFGNKKKKALPMEYSDDDEASEDDDDDEESDVEFTLDGAADLDDGPKKNTIVPPKKKVNKPQEKRRRRRSSARFLRLSAGGNSTADASENGADGADDEFTSSEHLGEIYRQAIRMNAENKINAGNSWGLKLIENMDKFIVEDGNNGGGNENHTEESARDELKAARKMKSKDDKGRVNFTKASCTLDASVKIYSYRVDDVHLSSYRVLANLNRTDNKKDNSGVNDVDGSEGVEDGSGEKVVKRRTTTRGPTETLETNLSNINMSKLDSAYDIDPLFHKMSKSFDEGGAKGLLLGNLGVSHHGCHIVFDSKEEKGAGKEEKLEKIGEEDDEDQVEKDDEEADGEEEKFDIDPEEAVVWKESEIDITNLASKLSSILASHGHSTSSEVPFVPQLESLREDYAQLEEEGFGVDEKDAMKEGRKRLRLYDAPDEEEKEAERSIHVIAMERSRGSILGMSFDTNFRLSMGGAGMDGDDDDLGGGGDFAPEDFGGEGEFAPPETGSFGGGDGQDFEPDFGGDGGFDGGDDSQPGNFIDARSYSNSKVLLDALCNGDAFYENGASAGGKSDYAFFDMKKFERATDGNLWAGSQHWKKKPSALGKKDKDGEKRRVMFDDGDGDEHVEKKERKRATKKDRVFIDFAKAPDVDAIFEKKKATSRRPKKTRKDAYQMARTDRSFVLPPDAGVDISQLSRLFSRPNAAVRRRNNDIDNDRPVGKTVGFYDVEENPLGGFDDDDAGDFGGDDGGFTFAYGEDEDNEPAGGGADDADYNMDNFDEVRKVEKINIAYATVAKKVDVRRLKKDLWTELEEKTSRISPETFPEKGNGDDAADEEKQDDPFEEGTPNDEPRFVSFKDTVEKMDMAQSQNDVTVSFYFICCLHLANEKGLQFDSTGLEDFQISLDDGSAPTFGTFGDGFSQTADKLAGLPTSRGKREKKAMNYVEEDEDEEEHAGEEDSVELEE